MEKTNPNNIMKKNEYVETLIVNGKLVNVGLDDNGQQYFFQFYDEDEKDIVTISCGSYNTDYKQEIEDYFKTDTEQIWDTLINHRALLKDLVVRIETIEERLGIEYDKE